MPLATTPSSAAAALERLNKVLLRTGSFGFSTCHCLVLNEAGGITLANAGHLSPYLNGQELALAGGLPFGVLRGNKYEQISFQLPEEARLTLLSDGVVEARSSGGEPFGFDRTYRISKLTPREIAEQARAHGQEDDITNITLDWGAPMRLLSSA